MIMGIHLDRDTNMADISSSGVLLFCFEGALALYLDTSPTLKYFLFLFFLNINLSGLSFSFFSILVSLWMLVLVNITLP